MKTKSLKKIDYMLAFMWSIVFALLAVSFWVTPAQAQVAPTYTMPVDADGLFLTDPSFAIPSPPSDASDNFIYFCFSQTAPVDPCVTTLANNGGYNEVRDPQVATNNYWAVSVNAAGGLPGQYFPSPAVDSYYVQFALIPCLAFVGTGCSNPDNANAVQLGYAYFEYDGADWAYQPSTTPPPDNDFTTHVIVINEPESYDVVASTTPVTVDFDYYYGSQPATAYELQFRNQLSGAYYEYRGYLDEGGAPLIDSVNNISTSTPAISEVGTYTLTVVLLYGPTFDTPTAPRGYYSGDKTRSTVFSVDVEDNTSTVVLGPAVKVLDPALCEINFLGTFSLAGCLEYMFTPSANVFQAYSSLTQLLDTKAPFVFTNQIGDIRTAMFEAEQTGSTVISVTVDGFGEIVFLTRDMIEAVPFSGLIRNVLAALMYFLMAEFIYRKVLAIHN